MLVEKPNGGSVWYFQATNLSDTMLALVLERERKYLSKIRLVIIRNLPRRGHLYYSAFGLSEARKQCQQVFKTSIVEYSFECDVLSRLEIFIRFVIGLDRELALLQTDTTTIRTRQQLSRADQNFRLKKKKRTLNLSESDLISIGNKANQTPLKSCQCREIEDKSGYI